MSRYKYTSGSENIKCGLRLNRKERDLPGNLLHISLHTFDTKWSRLNDQSERFNRGLDSK